MVIDFETLMRMAQRIHKHWQAETAVRARAKRTGRNKARMRTKHNRSDGATPRLNTPSKAQSATSRMCVAFNTLYGALANAWDASLHASHAPTKYRSVHQWMRLMHASMHQMHQPSTGENNFPYPIHCTIHRSNRGSTNLRNSKKTAPDAFKESVSRKASWSVRWWKQTSPNAPQTT